MGERRGGADDHGAVVLEQLCYLAGPEGEAAAGVEADSVDGIADLQCA